MSEQPKHQKFLEAFIETRDISSAAKLAGIENPHTLKSYYYKYKNYYRALFEKIGMPEESTLEILSDLAANAEKDSDKLKAIEMILKVMGTLTESQTIIVGADTTNKDIERASELAMYEKIKENGLTDKLFEILETGATAAKH